MTPTCFPAPLSSVRSVLREQRGSVLLVALIFSLVFAISITSYLQLSSTALRVSQRSFLTNDAMNINEAGLEQLLWSFNYANDQKNAGVTVTAWANWNVSGNNAWKSVSGFTFSQNATGTSKLYLQDYNSNGNPSPVAVCKSIITPANGLPIIKMVQVTLTRRSYFSTGLVAKDGVTFSGNAATVDSWNSNPLNASTSPAYAYNSVNAPRAANGGVASLNVNSTVNVQNANIYGYVSIGSTNEANITLGSNGLIGDLTALDGTRDESRITTDFTQDLPDVVVPTQTYKAYTETGNNNYITGAGNCQLPENSDINGNAAWKVTANGVTTYYYSVQYIDLTGNAGNQFTVKAGYNVVLKVTGTSGGDAVKTAGSAGVTIGTGSSLAIYTSGNVKVTGDSSGHGGLANSGLPTAFQVWGTGAAGAGQAVQVEGNGSLSGIVYAPNAAVEIRGNGEVYGSVVGSTINVVGSSNFHYDESLANWGGSNPFKVAKWSEIRSATARATWDTAVNAVVGSTYF